MTTHMARPGVTRAVPCLRAVWKAVSWSAVIGLVLTSWFWWPDTLGGRTGYVLVSGTSMEPQFHTGDLVVLRAHDHYRVGDVVAYEVPADQPGAGHQVIHRIIAEADGIYVLQGDNRTEVDPWAITDDDIIGSVVWSVGGASTPLLVLRSPLVWAVVAGALTTALVATGKR